MSPELAAEIAQGRAWAAQQRAEFSRQMDDYEAALDALETAADDPAALDQLLEIMARIAGARRLRLLPGGQPDQ